MKRIFTVRLNVDDMCASLDLVDGEEGRSDWILGFKAGVRGAKSRWEKDTAGALGFEMGSNLLNEAMIFNDAKSKSGKSSANKRLANETSTKGQRTANEMANETSTKGQRTANEMANEMANETSTKGSTKGSTNGQPSNIYYPVSTIQASNNLPSTIQRAHEPARDESDIFSENNLENNHKNNHNHTAAIDIPPRLMEVWREISQETTPAIANAAIAAARRLFPGTSPSQLLMTYQANAKADRLTLPATEWLDFTTKIPEAGKPAAGELAPAVRSWFVAACRGATIYAKSEAILAAMRSCGPGGLRDIAERVVRAGEGELSGQAFADMVDGTRSLYDSRCWDITPIPNLDTPLTDDQILEAIT